MHQSELLMPAGNLSKLKTAILYGADAVYIGTPDMSLRTRSEFSVEDVVEGTKFAHDHGKRVYLTLNLFSHNKDIEKLPSFLETIQSVKPDGVIVADPGIFHYIKKNVPDLELHISTQANICSSISVDFWKEQGAELCVLAREVSFAELAEIREKCPDIKLETFIHGAMCMTYSGRCLLSNYMTERGANQGNCAHNCRWNYKLKLRLKDGSYEEIEVNDKNSDMFEFLLEEEFRPGDFLPIEEDERGAYIMNSKDLCLMPKLDELLRVGVDSLKVEGRNKSHYYLAIVARAYRLAIDAWYKDPENWSPEPYLKEILTVPGRGYTLGFHEGRLTHLAHNYDFNRSLSDWEFAGSIVEWDGDDMIFEVKNRLLAGDVLEFVCAGSFKKIRLRLYSFIDADTGKEKEAVHAGQKPRIRIPVSLFHKEKPEVIKRLLPPLTVARKEKALTEEEQQFLSSDRVEQAAEIEGEVPAESNKPVPQKVNKKKSPKLGTNGCCGRGCNGCLIFWHDDQYKDAREALQKKKMGERLDKNWDKK
ncbi:MAG: U32 family peptidase [Alphaproteobacteria bacterium]